MSQNRINGKNATAVQLGALCWRRQAGKLRVLMITSRMTQRWIIPKGWAMAGRTAAEAAAQEAWEEAGVMGKVKTKPIGSYRYLKTMPAKQSDIPCKVDVYPLKVKDLSTTWPEMDERRRRWMSLGKAAARVREPDLAQLLKRFDPRKL